MVRQGVWNVHVWWGTSKCTKASVTAESKDSTWKISNKSSWKKSNKAFAKATGTHYFNGIPKESFSRTVTIACSSKGKIS